MPVGTFPIVVGFISHSRLGTSPEKRFGKGRLIPQSLERDWTNPLYMIFMVDQSDSSLPDEPETARGFLLVRGLTLDDYHWPTVSHDVLPYLQPKPVW